MTRPALFVAPWDPESVASWSGTPFYMLSALRRVSPRVEVLALPQPLGWRVAARAVTQLSRRKYMFDRARPVLGRHARAIDSALRRLGGDAVVVAPSSVPITLVDPGIPVGFWTDCVFPQMVGFYPQHPPYSDYVIDRAIRQEGVALRRAEVSGYSSEWAIAGAQRIEPE